MRVGTLLGFVALFVLCSCEHGPQLKGYFDLDVNLQGLGITNRIDILDRCASIKPLQKKVGSVDPRGRGRERDIEVRYGDTQHIKVIVDLTGAGNISVTGCLFDDSYGEFEKFYQRLLHELGTNFPNRVKTTTPIHRVERVNYE